jgi:glycosyltransferase involved in cell wall biosynthesis
VQLIGKLDRPGFWDAFSVCGAGDYLPVLQKPGFAVTALSACAWQRPDHLISIHLNFGPLAHWAKRAFGTPFTLVAHGIDVHNDLSAARRRAFLSAERVVAVSEWTRRRLLDLGIKPTHIAVLPNTVNESRFTVAARPEWLADRYNLRPGERVVLTVARLDSTEGYKGYDRIVQALVAIQASCGPVRFIVVGAGDDRARLKALARAVGIEQAVTFGGFVPDDELADHYRLADVFAMPSTGEGFGIVFLEAMACGTPVLGGNCDGSVDALDGGRLGRLVDPNDTSAIASGIIALLKREGAAWWFDRDSLHNAVIKRFGRAAFQKNLQKVFSPTLH